MHKDNQSRDKHYWITQILVLCRTQFDRFGVVTSSTLLSVQSNNKILLYPQTIISKTNETATKPRGGYRIGLPQHRVLGHSGVG